MSTDDLPIPDYDHLPIGSLQSRIRTLDRAGLDALIAYEEAHAHRTQALQFMAARRDELDAGAEPSGGDPAGVQPERGGASASGSPVDPSTAGPAITPPMGSDVEQPRQPQGGANTT